MTANCGLQTGRVACVVFLGCPKNQVDSEHVLGSLSEAGCRLTTDPRSADLIVVTTCAFLQSAVRESEAAIAEALKLKQGSSDRKVVVAGCLVERYGTRLKHRFPEVDLWVPLRDMPKVGQLTSLRLSPIANRSAESSFCSLHSAVCIDSPRVLSTPAHLAYLKIADGCDNRCSYCTIPDIRGSFRSRPMRDILAEARTLAKAGVKELILVAQDTTQYGKDICGKPGLARLLKELSKIDGIRWLRLMYAHPAHLTEEVIDQFRANPKLCRYVDLPIQHVSDRLLARMNRRYTRGDVETLLDSLRTVPDLHIRTTIIVGLPGETRQDFAELLAFVRKARFDRLSCYAYSAEPGTKAARMSGQVSPAVKKARVRRLMLAQAAISRANLKKLVGRELTVLVDAATDNRQVRPESETESLTGEWKLEPGNSLCVARTEWDAPEIDGVVKLSGRRIRDGTFVSALIRGSSTHDLMAEVV